jgi:lactate permease
VPWPQVYDPLHNPALSTALAALPVAVLLGGIAIARMPAHRAALLGLAVALTVALAAYGMPFAAAVGAAGCGAIYGLFPIGWIVLNLIFLYQLTVERGWFRVMRSALAGIAPDPRVQVILVAFSFGSFFEGAAGFGTPVAITAALLMQLGFRPLAASGLSLIANTAPVAFGALGTPLIALATVTGLDLRVLSTMVGRDLAIFSVIVPFWVVWAMAGWRGMLGVWPAALVAGVSFGVVQLLVAQFHGPWLVDIAASIVSMASLVLLLRFWRPKTLWTLEPSAGQEGGNFSAPPDKGKPQAEPAGGGAFATGTAAPSDERRAWLPWILLSAVIFVWGLPQVKAFLDGFSKFSVHVPGLDLLVQRMPPVVARPSAEPAILVLNLLSATGTGILAAAILSGWVMGFPFSRIVRIYGQTLYRVRHSLLTIAAMLSLGYVTRYGGLDATLGLALARSGGLYPFFGTLLGWLGVALTGSDTSSNVLFGSLQRITSERLGISPVMMAAANSAGGVMGKMVDAQSIVVASTATNWYGHEGSILRFVFFHSLALAALMGLLVYAQATFPLFANMVVR